MSEQEMQFELMKSQEKVNALRQEVAEMNKEREFWQQVRITIAAHIAGGLAQRGVFSANKTVEWTDALIEELQKGGEDERD